MFAPQLWLWENRRFSVFRLNVHWVNFPSQRVRADRRKTTGTHSRPRDVEKAMPTFNNLPNWLKRFMGAIANIPEYNSLFLMINYRSYPESVLFVAYEGL